MIKSVGALKNVWKIPDLKRKILYTLMILLVYRIGAHIPTPFIDRQALQEYMARARAGGGGLFQVIDMFSGQAFSNMSIMALGIMPYISASIILQLLTVVFPRLQKIQQEGELGRKKINRWTRYGTIGLSAFQGLGVGVHLVQQRLTYFSHSNVGLFLFTTMMAMTAGTAFIMWLGERISDKGIGNGISMIIAVGIMARYPFDLGMFYSEMSKGITEWIWAPLVIVLFIAASVSIILIQEGTRRIPMQHAKRVVGRRVLSGGTNYLPLKVNTAGVIPVIFASAILSFPSFIASYFSGGMEGGGWFGNLFAPDSTTNLFSLYSRWFPRMPQGGVFLLLKSCNLYVFLYALGTGFFCYFYTAIAFNPDDVANNLKKSGSFIPGKRPGKPTSEYIDYVLTRVTTVGALFLIVIALVPIVMRTSFRMSYQVTEFVGGTGLIIVIGVLLETLKQIESQLLMRHYEGFALRRTATARWR